MTEVERYSGSATWVDMLPAVGELAGKIAGTDFVPKPFRGNVAAVAACILAGHELGLGPMTALRGINVIQGRVTMSAEMLGARVYAAGHSLEWVTSTDTEARVKLTRGDGLGSAEVAFTMDMARRAGLAGHDNYRHYPEAMLRARALSSVVTMAAPDVSLGLEAAAPVTGPVAAPKAVRLTGPRAAVEYPPGTAPEPEVPEVLPLPSLARVTENPRETKPAPEVTDPAGHASNGQIRRIMGLLNDLSTPGPRMTRDERLAKLAGILGFDNLDTMNALSVAEASKVIDALAAEYEYVEHGRLDARQ